MIVGLSVLLVVMIAIAGWLNYNVRTSQKEISLDKKTCYLGTFPMINSLISTAHDIPFLIDTGTDLSMLKHRAIAILKAKGYMVDSVFCPVFYRNNKGNICFATKRYIVDLPLAKWYVVKGDNGAVYYKCDSSTNTNVMRRVNFIPATDDVNVIGLDLLRNIVMEYRVDQGAVSFFTQCPEGYQKLAALDRKGSLANLLGCADRYTVRMELGGNKHDYFVNTTLDLVHMKHPLSDTITSTSPLYTHVVLTPHGTLLKARISPKEWLTLGQRSGTSTVSYFDDDEDYAINPMRLFSQDVVLDFHKKYLYLRPQYDMAGYPDKLPEGDPTKPSGIDLH